MGVDNIYSTVGTLDFEVTALTIDRAFEQEMGTMFEMDFAHAEIIAANDLPNITIFDSKDSSKQSFLPYIQ